MNELQSGQPQSSSVTVFQVRGMTCQNCARHVSEAIAEVPNVATVRVDLDGGTAHVRWQDPSNATTENLTEAVTEAGFEISPLQSGGSNPQPKTSWWMDWRTSVWIAVPTFIFLFGTKWTGDWHAETWFRWLSFALATVVQIVCGGRFYRGAWQQLRHGRSNMDTLVSLGSTTAFIYSTTLLFTSSTGHLYFKESVGIIAFVSIGHWIESRVARRASGALESLLALTPSTATAIDEAGKRSTVPLNELTPGHSIVVAPGEQIPVDGTVRAGASTCDESMLTGEANPIDKSEESRVYAGTLNLSGELTIQVSGTGNDTALARIIAVVERAQTSRAQIQKLADQISSVFVPVVVLIAVATFIAWIAFPDATRAVHNALQTVLWSPNLPAGAWAAGVIHAAAVLIIACPCAMGLATPIAIMAGTNVAARHGVLIRDGDALERSGRITHVLFDKTGTLTQGTPSLAESRWLLSDETDARIAKRLLASLARKSKHPLSQSIANALPADDGPETFTEWQEFPGRGLEAVTAANDDQSSTTWRLGSLTWLNSCKIPFAGEESFITAQRSKGATLVGFTRDEEFLALFVLRDQLKPEAKSMIQTLRNLGVEVGMISGDHPQTAQAIAAELNIQPDFTHAGVTPERKAELVEGLQQSGQSVCFVGDGINDAPALEQSDLGIAVRSASDIAKESADLVLLQSDIQVIPKALEMARGTLRTIKQNLFWAFFYNAVGVPLAALGFLSPILCAAAMGLSDLVVVGNALRLRFKQF